MRSMFAVVEFRARLTLVGPEQWAAPTPCEAWDVHLLVAHVVGGHRFTSLVLAGSAADEAFAAVTASAVLGPDPLLDHDEMAARQRLGFRRPGALSSTVDHPAGRISGAAFLAIRVFDVTVHTRDLARATGGDERLDAALADVALAGMAGLPGGVASGSCRWASSATRSPPRRGCSI